MKRCTSRCLALASVAAAAAAVSAARPQYGGTLRAELDAVVATLDPAHAAADSKEEAARARIVPLVFETLTSVEPDGLRPLLAVSWESDARGSRWRFRLRPGVVLHDRKPLEAWQVAESLRASEPSWQVAPEGDAIAIDAGEPSPDLPWVLAAPRHAVAVRGSGGAFLGTGPFRIDHVDGAQVLLKAHEPYWRARPFVDAVQIDMGRRLETQLTDLEAGRADIVSIRAIDSRRLSRRGLHVEASRPLELVALVFEPHRAGDAALAWRRAVAGTINRDAICTVVLQGNATPAQSILPDWLSGYARVAVARAGPALSAAAVAALGVDQTTIVLRVDPGDAVTQAIAERLAVDAREAGFTIQVQAPVGLAPRADARLVRVAIAATTADRALLQASGRLAVRGVPATLLPPGSSLEATYRAEQAAIDPFVVVPVVHLAELYGIGDRVGAPVNAAARPTGGWNLADLWLQDGKP
jgi:peptide/nickel transport system substrate-binding protein